MDTTKIEYTAEDLISHSLQRANILVAKPKFDREGTDLLAFVEMNDGVKFCRIQCKGRSLLNSKTSNVKIKTSYVTPGFVFFLYIEENKFEKPNIYVFFSGEIEMWKVVKNEYVLNINKSFRETLKPHEFNSTKIHLIKKIITQAEATGEFQKLVLASIGGKLNFQLGPKE